MYLPNHLLRCLGNQSYELGVTAFLSCMAQGDTILDTNTDYLPGIPGLGLIFWRQDAPSLNLVLDTALLSLL
jgi:hypothetical protein